MSLLEDFVSVLRGAASLLRERLMTQEEREAADVARRLEAVAAQGGGSLELPNGREVIVHVVRERGKLDVGGRVILGFDPAFPEGDVVGSYKKATNCNEPPKKIHPAAPLTGSRADRFPRRRG